MMWFVNLIVLFFIVVNFFMFKLPMVNFAIPLWFNAFPSKHVVKASSILLKYYQ